ncbi:type IV pilus twitching motility protein PilT [Glaciihabitans arcticus]|uniref:Type IV pilus twitching motility protein PilT n=1 Tax=Glaciihabitans arcticus TaxID=2668039 RepID=A0A4Q9H0I1_9MICO|nr:type IV pilus twitching motility protein PilT [Glaciihabitans arcticus]
MPPPSAPHAAPSALEAAPTAAFAAPAFTAPFPVPASAAPVAAPPVAAPVAAPQPDLAAAAAAAAAVEAAAAATRNGPAHKLPEVSTAPAAEAVIDLSPQVGEGEEGSDPDLVAALNAVVTARASDLHVTAKSTPMIRVDGGLRPAPGMETWDSEKVAKVLHSIMSPKNREIFEEKLELDFAYRLSDSARFRVNVYQQRHSMGAAFRLIPTEIKQLSSLGIPESIARFATLARGLVLVTGPTGSGKSTTLAALIDLVNSTRADHIVTVEDPIEFMHTNKKSVVNQREVGADTHSFQNALKHVLRQDPDVILIGELRDLETISVALTAAETGHLVFATLHTQDAPQTIDRVIDVFPPHQQGQVRAQLAATLQGVVCQTLVKKIGGGRAVATEVLITTPAVANLIREGKTYQVQSAMQAGRELGMHTMDQHLADLVNAGQISYSAAAEKVHDEEVLKRLVTRTGESSAAAVNFGDSYSSGN